jgi:hypothetical protein
MIAAYHPTEAIDLYAHRPAAWFIAAHKTMVTSTSRAGKTLAKRGASISEPVIRVLVRRPRELAALFLLVSCTGNTALDADASRALLDLSDPATIEVGTCGAYLFDDAPRRRGTQIPDDPNAYPLEIILPAVTQQDPACPQLCGEPIDDAFPPTLWGIAIEFENHGLGLRNIGRGLRIEAPAPWYIVSGGCGEACPWPCLEGYQEFGEPLRVHERFYGALGFATGEIIGESRRAKLFLVSSE